MDDETPSVPISTRSDKTPGIPMRLVCEGCGKLHIDEGEFATKPHHTHSCQHCGLTWRPAVVNTTGVQFLPGFRNEDHPKKKPDRVVELGHRVAEFEAAAIEELPAGWRCRLCRSEVMSEDGTDPVPHKPTCPMARGCAEVSSRKEP